MHQLELLPGVAGFAEAVDVRDHVEGDLVGEVPGGERLSAGPLERLAAELERQSDFDAASNVYRRLLELEPNRDEALGAFGRNLLRQNKAPEAESVARRAIARIAPDTAFAERLIRAISPPGD